MTSCRVDISPLARNADFSAMTTLHRLAVNGEKAKIESLLKQCNSAEYKCDVNERDKYGRTPLIYAVLGDWFDCAEVLIRNGASVSEEDRDKRKPIHWAAYLGRVKSINLFLRHTEKNIRWNTGDLDGRTPLHYAAAHRDPKCLRLLLKQVTPDELDAKDREMKTALHWSVYYGNLEHIKLFINCSAKISLRDAKWNSVLHLAVANPNADSVRIVRLLLKQNRYFSAQKDLERRVPLHLAVANGNEDLVRELCAAEIPALDEQDSLSRTPLHYAVLRNNVNIVKILVSSGASLYKQDTTGATVLHYAAKSNNIALMNYFLSQRDLEDISDKQDRTALMWAASEGAEGILTVMLNNLSHFKIHACDNQGLTALHYACLAGSERCVEQLIAKSADISQSDNLGQIPLFKACQQGFLNIVSILLNAETLEDARAPVNVCINSVTARNNKEHGRNSARKGEFAQTFVNNRRDITEKSRNGIKTHSTELERKKWGSNQTKLSPIDEQFERTAILGDESESDESNILDDFSGDLIPVDQQACIRDLQDDNGCTPLHFAAHDGHVDVVKWLLRNGVDPRKKDSSNRTALHGAAFNGHSECIQLILFHKPELVNDRDEDGYSALHRAAANGHLEAVKMLMLNYGAYPNYRLKGSNLTPLDVAISASQQDVTQFLLDHRGLTIAGCQENASQKIKKNLIKWIRKRKQASIKPLLEKHRMLIKEDSLKNNQETNPDSVGDESSEKNLNLRNAEHVKDPADAFPNPTTYVVSSDDAGLLVKDFTKCDHEDESRSSIAWSAMSSKSLEHRSTENVGSHTPDTVPGTNHVQVEPECRVSEDFDPIALFEASCRGSLKCIENLLANGSDVRSKNEKGRTALHLAALHGHEDICHRLIKHGADLRERDENGLTPLHHAVSNNHKNCISVLLNEKQDLVTYLDFENRKALHYAESKGYLEAAKLLTLTEKALGNAKPINQTSPNSETSVQNENVKDNMSEQEHETGMVFRKNSPQTLSTPQPSSAFTEFSKCVGDYVRDYENRSAINELNASNTADSIVEHSLTDNAENREVFSDSKAVDRSITTSCETPAFPSGKSSDKVNLERMPAFEEKPQDLFVQNSKDIRETLNKGDQKLLTEDLKDIPETATSQDQELAAESLKLSAELMKSEQQKLLLENVNKLAESPEENDQSLVTTDVSESAKDEGSVITEDLQHLSKLTEEKCPQIPGNNSKDAQEVPEDEDNSARDFFKDQNLLAQDLEDLRGQKKEEQSLMIVDCKEKPKSVEGERSHNFPPDDSEVLHEQIKEGNSVEDCRENPKSSERDGAHSSLGEHVAHLPVPPERKDRHSRRTPVGKHFRTHDFVADAGEKERILKLRRDWERIALVRRKVQAAVVIQRCFRKYLGRKNVNFAENASVSPRNDKTVVKKESNRKKLIAESKVIPLTKRQLGPNRLRKKPANSANFTERRKVLKSCFPLISPSTSSSSCSKSLSPSRSRSQSPGPENQASDLACRSRLTTDQIVEEWLCKRTASNGLEKLRASPREEENARRRRTKSANVPGRRTKEDPYLRPHSLPEGKRTSCSASTNSPGTTNRSESRDIQTTHRRLLADHLGRTRECLIRTAYDSPAAVSFNFALDHYHPMASRQGCKQTAFPYKTSSRVRPNSMRRGVNGWVHTTEFAQAIAASKSLNYLR